MTHDPIRPHQPPPRSMVATLVCHPANPCPLPMRIDVAVDVVAASRHTDPGWQLRYVLHAPIAQLAIPQTATAGPADGLWRHTCFEAFVGLDEGPAYREFNFSPSGQWAAYSFKAERVRNESHDIACHPVVPVLATPALDGPASLVLEAWLPAQALPLPTKASSGCLTLGLSAVVETRDGHLSYWALDHSGRQPDFHHARSRIWHLPHPSPACPTRPPFSNTP